MATQVSADDQMGAQRSALYWDLMDSPLGDVRAIVNEDGALVQLDYGGEASALTQVPTKRGGPAAFVRDPKRLESVRTQLDEYFAGERKSFEIAVDLSGLTPFHQSVLEATRRIPWGSVSSYKGIALAIGNPPAARAVGGALGRNPIGIVIPCHRVLASDGSLGGYSGAGGLKTKRFLLNLEQTASAS